MIKYILGWLNNIFNPSTSLIVLIDNKSRISRKSKIWRFCKIYKSTISSYSYIGPNSKVVFASIGKFCSIAGNCTIGVGKHSLENISTSPIFTSKINGTGYSWTKIIPNNEYQKIIIGNDVWIGTNVTIIGGITIGDGAIIGAGAIVTKDIPPYAIAVGVPAKVIKYRFEKPLINKLLEIQWWNKTENQLKNSISLFQNSKLNISELEKIK